MTAKEYLIEKVNEIGMQFTDLAIRYAYDSETNFHIIEIDNTAIIHQNSRTVLEERLKAKFCELCGTTTASLYEIHHIHKLKDLKGKEFWKQTMIAKKRKTLVVCHECHKKIHGKKVSKSE